VRNIKTLDFNASQAINLSKDKDLDLVSSKKNFIPGKATNNEETSNETLMSSNKKNF